MTNMRTLHTTQERDLLPAALRDPGGVPKPRAPIEQLRANRLADRELALETAIGDASASFEATREEAQNVIRAAATRRDAAISEAQATAEATRLARAVTILDGYHATMRPLLARWFFDEPGARLADQIAQAHASFVTTMTLDVGSPFCAVLWLLACDVFASGNDGSDPKLPRVSMPHPRLRSRGSFMLTGPRGPAELEGAMNKAVEFGGPRVTGALADIETLVRTRAVQASMLAEVPEGVSRFRKLLACGSAFQFVPLAAEGIELG